MANRKPPNKKATIDRLMDGCNWFKLIKQVVGQLRLPKRRARRVIIIIYEYEVMNLGPIDCHKHFDLQLNSVNSPEKRTTEVFGPAFASRQNEWIAEDCTRQSDLQIGEIAVCLS